VVNWQDMGEKKDYVKRLRVARLINIHYHKKEEIILSLLRIFRIQLLKILHLSIATISLSNKFA